MNIKLTVTMMIAVQLFLTALLPAAEPVDLTEPMKQSLVYLEISNSQYEQYQPWKQSPISKDGGYGCAVGPYEVLTTAENVINATFLQARLYSQNEYIPATIKIVDYEYNLCLLTLDKTTMSAPLKPLKFKEVFQKGQRLDTYWLSAGGHLTNARSTLDRAEMFYSNVSFVKNLQYLATNTSRPFGDGEVCCSGKDVIGMACLGTESDSWIIPSETINRFLTQSKEETYDGFGLVGFKIYDLLDPTMRKYLKVPESIDYGVYVNTVYHLGTGSKELKSGDVILSVDGHTINPYGRYLHDQYDRLSFENIILQKSDGDKIPFEIWREGKKEVIEVVARNFKSEDMLVPYYLYGKQPEYVVIGGFIFQKMTRDYLRMWGEGWQGKVPPHLYHYYGDLAFKPEDDRRDVVVLNYVLPSEINLGYQDLSRLVVSSINDKKISSIEELIDAISSDKDAEFLVIEFEMDSPKVIIPRLQLDIENMKIAQLYGIPQMSNIEK
ncbi:MAG: hypothetical protein H8E62_02960 [Planctomycetes bacterium]|nr:hypothetical protein [Planctomycetota bacterium]